MVRRQNKKERVLGLDGKMRDAVHTLLCGNPDLQQYLDPDGGVLTVRDYTFAGGGASFLIEALISLGSGEAKDAVDLHRIADLDEHNRALFLHALEAYLNA